MQIFNVKQKDVPIETLKLSTASRDGTAGDESRPISFGWESFGDKFCVLMGTERLVAPVFYQCTAGKISEISAFLSILLS